MRIALSQFDPGTDPAANADHLVGEAARAAAAGAQLLLAPEGSLVSFLQDPTAPGRAAQELDGPFVSALAAASAEHGIAIGQGAQHVGGALRRPGGRGLPEGASVRRVFLR
jgi:predicted amidohydrolase